MVAHGLQQGGVGILCGACYTPCAQHSVCGVGIRTYKGYLPLFLQGKNIAFVAQQDEGLGGEVSCRLTMFLGEDMLCLLFLCHAAMLVGIGKEAQLILGFQYAATGLVDIFHGDEAFAECFFPMSDECIAAHVHVGTSLECPRSVGLQVSKSMRGHLLDACIISDHEALESPCLPEYLIHQPWIGRCMLTIHQVETCHYTFHTSLHGSLVGREILVEHAQVAHVHGVVVTSCF